MRFVYHTCWDIYYQVVLDYFHSHWQPWVKRDIQAILDGPTIAPVRDGPYVGIHVRRSDKIGAGGETHDVQVLTALVYNKLDFVTRLGSQWRGWL